jgi:putative flippase GtrA
MLIDSADSLWVTVTEAVKGGDVGVVRPLYERSRHLVHEIAKFGVVGLVAYVIDTGTFNILKYDGGAVAHKVITDKIISTALAATFAYFANRHWTWKARARTGLGREYVMFFVLNGVGLGIALACLATSHYGFGLHTALADNISANVIGTILGTVFRFWAYRRWVFIDVAEPMRTEGAAAAAIV